VTPENFEKYIRNGETLAPFTISKRDPLFPRVEEELLVDARLEALKKEKAEAEAKKAKAKEAKKNGTTTEGVALIGIDQFFATSLKIGTVVQAEEVKKSKKLLLLQVDIGEDENRQVVAGIKEWYSAQDILNSQVCVVANLKPAKLMGMKSEGMLLAAKDATGLCLIRPEKPKANGTPIS